MKDLGIWVVLILCSFVVGTIDSLLGIDLTGFSFLAQVGHIFLYMAFGALIAILSYYSKKYL